MHHNNSTPNRTPRLAAQRSGLGQSLPRWRQRFSVRFSVRLSVQLSALVCGVGLLLGGPLGEGMSDAQAQTKISPDEGVAAALFDRGMTLFEQGDFANAKKMFVESLERSSQGNRSADALRMLRSSNEKLGVSDLNAGLPKAGNDPIDPYAEKGNGDDDPVDPYADKNAGDETPVDPYGVDPMDTGAEQKSDDEELPDEEPEGRLGRYGLLGHGAALGSTLLMTVAGPLGEEDGVKEDLSGGAVLLGVVGAGGGAYLAHYLDEKYDLSDGQSAAIATAGFWTMYNAGHLANLFSGDNSDLNDVYLGMSLGGVAGTGLGVWYAKKYEPNVREISLVNSLSLYGTTTALMLAVAIDPPKNDAYALNAVIGSAAGIGTAIYLRDELNYSRSRMLRIDMGAGIGALLPWVTIYPAMRDELSTRDEQTAGFLSAIGLGIGAYIGWAISKDKDEPEDSDSDSESNFTSAPALLRRSPNGNWSLSSPMIRPMELPTLAPRQGLLGTDILSGRF